MAPVILVATLFGLLGGASPAAAQSCSALPVPAALLPAPPDGASAVSCDTWDGIVDRDVVFDGPCTFYGQVRFAAPRVTLDCRGGAIDGSRIREVRGLAKWSCPPTGCRVPGITVIDRAVPLSQPLGAGTRDELTRADPSVDGVVIQGCEVRGFSGPGISLRRVARRADSDEDGESLRWDGWWQIEADDPARIALRHALAPHDVTVRDSIVRSNGHVGIYVWPYSERTRIERTRIEGNGAGGIYLDAQSRSTHMDHCVVVTDRAPAVHVDSSPQNRITHSCIGASGSGALGVIMYRNCGEAGSRRWYESRDNVVEHSVLEGFDVALWLGSRQGLTYSPRRPPRDCIDVDGESAPQLDVPNDACITPGWWGDTAATRRFRDHAPANQARDNRFVSNRRAVIVWDDESVLVRNEFVASTEYDVCIGQAFRQALSEPLRRVRLEDNLFVYAERAGAAPVIDAHGAETSISGSRYRASRPDPSWYVVPDLASSPAWLDVTEWTRSHWMP